MVTNLVETITSRLIYVYGNLIQTDETERLKNLNIDRKCCLISVVQARSFGRHRNPSHTEWVSCDGLCVGSL